MFEWLLRLHIVYKVHNRLNKCIKKRYEILRNTDDKVGIYTYFENHTYVLIFSEIHYLL